MTELLTSTHAETGTEGFVHGISPTILSVNALVVKTAPTNISVLITGESGTGKDEYARLIHSLSGVKDKFQKINCSAPGAARLLNDTCSDWKKANSGTRGTLYFDNLDESDPAWQKALLNWLSDDGNSPSDEPLGARLISSSSRSIETEVKEGRFRPELYFRLNGVCLHLPPLRERREDITALLEHFLIKHAGEMKRSIPQIDKEAEEVLCEYNWPGNLRELANLAQRMLAVGDLELTLKDLREGELGKQVTKPKPRGSSLKSAVRAALRRTERELILQALERTRWNRKRAAQELEISYKSLLLKMKQIGISTGQTEE